MNFFLEAAINIDKKLSWNKLLVIGKCLMILEILFLVSVLVVASKGGLI